MQPLRIDKQGRIRILQVTDSHLGEKPDERLTGVSTEQSFCDVLDLIAAKETDFDLVLLTGDVANHGTESAYLRAINYLDQLNKPWLWLPGNHDLPKLMNTVGEQYCWLRGVNTRHWQCHLLNSHIPGEVGGELATSEIERLRKAVSNTDKFHIAFVHHQPLPVGCDWIDTQKITNGSELINTLIDAPSAQALVWGHVHQHIDRSLGGLRLLATPSTCIQFAPNSAGFALDDAMPGYRWIELHDDGSITSGVERVAEKDYGVDFASMGY